MDNHLAEFQELLRRVTNEAVGALAAFADVRDTGEREGQYALDLVVDGPLVQSLLDAGLAVLSEEAGVLEPERELWAIVDPVDGSTNASRGLPWYNTSIAIVDADGPLVAIVENHVTGERYEAVRGHGATRNGIPIQAADRSIETGIVGVNGVPPARNPWAQFRCLGASALDLCSVAAGVLDGYVDFADEAHGVWDYAAALLVCNEAGVTVVDVFGRDLIHREHGERRTPVAAGNTSDLDALVALRRSM